MGERHDITHLSDDISLVVRTWEPNGAESDPKDQLVPEAQLIGSIFLGCHGGATVFIDSDNRQALRRLRNRINEAIGES